jgi:hypothetical protein
LLANLSEEERNMMVNLDWKAIEHVERSLPAQTEVDNDGITEASVTFVRPE